MEAYLPWIVFAMAVMLIVDRAFAAWSILTREREVNERANKATEALTQAWAEIERKDRIIAQLSAAVAYQPRKSKQPPQALPIENDRLRSVLNGGPKQESFDGLRGPR